MRRIGGIYGNDCQGGRYLRYCLPDVDRRSHGDLLLLERSVADSDGSDPSGTRDESRAAHSRNTWGSENLLVSIANSSDCRDCQPRDFGRGRAALGILSRTWRPPVESRVRNAEIGGSPPDSRGEDKDDMLLGKFEASGLQKSVG